MPKGQHETHLKNKIENTPLNYRVYSYFMDYKLLINNNKVNASYFRKYIHLNNWVHSIL